jgi:hypothetical protein
MRADFGGVPDDLELFQDELPEEPSAPTTATPTAPAYHPPSTPQGWLVLTPPHHDQVTTNFAREIATALIGEGQAARLINADGNLSEQLGGVALDQLAGVITIGTLPLSLRLDGGWLHQRLRCPVYAYFLDSPIYDIARVPAARQFIQDAWSEPRLVPLLAERSYLQLLGGGEAPLLPPQSRYMPFAAFPSEARSANTPPAQRRLLVVGSLGQELSGAAVRADLLQTLREANRSGLAEADLLRLAERLQRPDARGNCAADLMDVLGLAPRALLDLPLLNLVCAADSHVKRARRLAGIEALRGLPVDFIGPGWQQVFGEQADFRFLGSVDHGDIAALMGLYRGVLNFDPNWEWGMHDRAYTALSVGTPVLTHANQAIAEEGLAGPLVHEFLPNAPQLGDFAAPLLAPARAVQHTPLPLARIGWAARVRAGLLAQA